MAGDSVIYSASDLASAARCQYALLREFDEKLGRGQRVSVTDELLERTASLGDEHEQRRLDQLREAHDGDVAVIGRPFPFTIENITAAAAQTRRAIDRGAPVIYQAAMFDGRFVGFADFLVRRDGPFQVSDTKLARSANVTALLQIAAYADTLSDAGTPQFEVADPQPLALLPNPDEGDLFFDFEGDPLWTADGVDWGLEYLFGVLEGGKSSAFHPLWAHDRPGERKALIDFLALVAKRRKRFPNMHVYHYAAYEKTALLRLAGRHGVGEDDVDDLLRSGTLV